MKSGINFIGKTVVIVCHDSVPGPPHNLANFFLSNNIYRLLFIGHVNQFTKNNRIQSSYLKIYEKNVIVKTISGKKFSAPESIRYVHDFLLTLYWSVVYSDHHIDFFVGLGNLNAFAGILLRIVGKVSTSIYYVIDYVPQRFSNILMNNMYHLLDMVCALYANSTWNYGTGMIKARNNKWNRVFPHQLHTPHGVLINNSLLSKSKLFHRYELVYMGSLLQQQGIGVILDALPIIKQVIPNIKFVIIGDGPYKQALIKQVKKNCLDNSVTFKGYIEDSSEVDTLISQAVLGIATYEPNAGFVQYTEPSKVRRYLSCGTPVIISAGTPLSEDIALNNCGIVCEYNSSKIAVSIISILSNTKKLIDLRNNGIVYAKKYTWDRIYSQAFISLP